MNNNIVKKWETTGLLERCKNKHKKVMSEIYEATAQELLQSNHEDHRMKINAEVIFPMVARVYMDANLCENVRSINRDRGSTIVDTGVYFNLKEYRSLKERNKFEYLAHLADKLEKSIKKIDVGALYAPLKITPNGKFQVLQSRD